MAKKAGIQASEELMEETQIIGIRIPVELAREVKTEAARSGLKLNQLFVDMWKQYKAREKKKGS